jgi:hypothetical protein
MRAMFAPVRARSLKPLCYSVVVRASERERTRANAEPCHSCHAAVGIRRKPGRAARQASRSRRPPGRYRRARRRARRVSVAPRCRRRRRSGEGSHARRPRLVAAGWFFRAASATCSLDLRPHRAGHVDVDDARLTGEYEQHWLAAALDEAEAAADQRRRVGDRGHAFEHDPTANVADAMRPERWSGTRAMEAATHAGGARLTGQPEPRLPS